MRVCVPLGVMVLLLSTALVSRAEDGSQAWLRYAPVSSAQYENLPSEILVLGDSSAEQSAGAELVQGLSAMLGRQFRILTDDSKSGRTRGNTIFVGPYESFKGVAGLEHSSVDRSLDQYTIRFEQGAGQHRLLIAGNTPQAELYGVFRLLEEIGSLQKIPASQTQTASAGIRWTDEWDNLNGTIERGYAGPSFFFKDGHVLEDLQRASGYARLLASVGINGCNVNNVNADLDLLTSAHIKEFARLADAFRPWGVKLALSVDLTSPQTVGGLTTFDPLDQRVIAWWAQKVDEIYRVVPDFGGFTVKADSEGRLGPAKYGRSPADAANVLARALARHKGVVLYRGFVYNNHLDWRDPKADRARAGVDNFARYDGEFDSNVVIQIKEGPIDFQAREPVSPLFGTLRHTNMAIEVETSQEYTGQQRHMMWLPSMWKWVLDTDLQVENRSTPVKEIVEGRSFALPGGKSRFGGFISVTNAGSDANWLHHPMAMANLYGFGKLAWNPDEPLKTVIDTWTRLTWGNNQQVDETINAMQLRSWKVYEGYTGPNGMGTLTNILGYHFGPGIESAERNGWGQWFRGDKDAIGMDRTSEGTGFADQYAPLLAAKYNSLANCPDELLLFFHHVPYSHKLLVGETLIQSIYDTHYRSAREAGEYVPEWLALRAFVDPERFGQVLQLFTFQAGNAIVWRDAINDWFFRMSQIPDAQGRVGKHPDRFEAEDMTSVGYEPIEVSPWETASGGRAVVCRSATGCSLSTIWSQADGSYDIAVQYFDTWRGASRFELFVNEKSVARWVADDTLPPVQFDVQADGQTSTRFTAQGVVLKHGDTLILKGIPDLRPELNVQKMEAAEPGAIVPNARESRDYRELAPVDYIQIGPNEELTPQN